MERLVFFGSPAFALPSLEALAASEFTPVLVVTQPDRPAGRGKKVVPTPVRELAEKKGIPVRILGSFREGGALDDLRSAAPDFFVVVSFGRILPKEALGIAKKGNINLHASLLPRYRGASPDRRRDRERRFPHRRDDHGDGRGARFRTDLSADGRRYRSEGERGAALGAARGRGRSASRRDAAADRARRVASDAAERRGSRQIASSAQGRRAHSVGEGRPRRAQSHSRHESVAGELLLTTAAHI